MSNFERLCKLYKERKPKECKDIVRIQKELLKKRYEEAELKRKLEAEEAEVQRKLEAEETIRKEKKRARDRLRYAKNREKILESRKLYYNNVLKLNETYLQSKNKYRNDNKEKINEYQKKRDLEKKKKGIKRIRRDGYYKEYYQKNKEKIKEKNKIYTQNNPEKHKFAMSKWYYHNRRIKCANMRRLYAIKKFVKKLILKQFFYYLK